MRVDVDQMSKRRILTMYDSMLRRSSYLEALLFFYNPEDEYFAKVPENVKDILRENAVKIMEERESKKNAEKK